MGFRPLHDWVLIKRSEPEEKTSGGIIIPDAARTKPTEGIVEAIGPGKFEKEKGKKEKKSVPTVLKPGQRVMFIDYMTKDIVLDGEEITIIQEDNILGVLESYGPLAVKKQYNVEVRKDHPPMVQAVKEMTDAKEKVKVKTEKKISTKKRKEPAAEVELAVTFRKAVKTGKAIKQVKAEVKTNTKKTVAKGKDNTMKKTVKKAAPKKAAPAKKAVAKKTVAKKTAPKKAAAKKVVSKKTAAKKTVAKKAAAPKKTVARKVTKKKVAKKK